MFSFQTQIRVRYSETDQMGHVYYGNYAAYYEVARVEALRSAGISYKALEDSGVWLPVSENKSKYILPALYDDLLHITVSIPELPKVRFVFRYDFHDEKNRLIHQGETVLFFMDKNSRRPIKAPNHVTELLSPYYT